MAVQFELSALNESAKVEVGQSYAVPLRVAYSNRFYGSCVMVARLRRQPTGAPSIDRKSVSFEEVEVHRGTSQSLTAAAESFVLSQLQKDPWLFVPRLDTPGGRGSESFLKPALRQLRRLTP
jgi:hypothetical protein